MKAKDWRAMKNPYTSPQRQAAAEAMVVRTSFVLDGTCPTCEALARGEICPPHDASPRCESGKRNHCTCDTCF